MTTESDPKPTGLRAPDGYEKAYMTGEGEVLHREKSVSPWYFHAIFLVPALFTLGASIIPAVMGTPDGLVGLAISAPIALFLIVLWLIFSVLRVTVSSTWLHVQYGLFGPKIPISSIRRAEAIDYDWKHYGGWGIRRSMKDGSWIYNMMGDGGRGARLTYVDESGVEKTVVVGCANADMLVHAVNRARAKSTPTLARARVESPVEEAASLEDAAQEEEQAKRSV
jgi:hypothetical protein